ncbi:MAG: sigma 54-interacting transcriptional regulator [Thermoanaerobaculales bacterium]|nr:sigma 54-interacting transcriptional regulator [Thermoanaerobaculales bacterium]
MSRRPLSAALLLDHPAFPNPKPAEDEAVPDLEGSVSIRTLARAERRRLAVQLLAAAALGAEFDLWPGRAALVGARAHRKVGGVQAVLGGFPVPLTPVHRRLGGGDRALETTRAAVIEAVGRVTGVPIHDLMPVEGAGFFLEGSLRRSLSGLKRPLDPVTGRNLWAFRWPQLILPDEGEILFYKVSRDDLAGRLAGAAWADLREGGREVHLITDNEPPKNAGPRAVAVLMGKLSHEGLASLEIWAREEGRSAVVVGLFPPGWDPPVPEGCSGSLSRQLAVTGVSLDRARREVEAHEGYFDPWALADREALTTAACRLFEQQSVVVPGSSEATADPVYRLLSLCREGLPEPVLGRLGGRGIQDLTRRASEGEVVFDGDLWRLSDPPKLRKDPLHEEVAHLFPDGDPRRLLHLALAGESVGELETWARNKLDCLENLEVGTLLGEVETGQLGPAVAALRVEAGLGELDLSGAREGCSALNDVDGRPWRLWIDLEDLEDGWRPESREVESLIERAPRVAAEVAIHAIRIRGRRSLELEMMPEDLLDRAIERLGGELKRWYEILRVAALEPAKLRDEQWRIKMVGANSKLRGLVEHKLALQFTEGQQIEAAREILTALAQTERSPGRLGQIHLDLGIVAEDPRAETTHLLRALRFLEAAGFLHTVKKPLFNLGVVDVERLQLDRAEERVRAGAAQDHPLRMTAEGQIALGRGRLKCLRDLLGTFPEDLDSLGDSRVEAGVESLRGALALIEGRRVQARKHLLRGGEDGEAWLQILDAFEGGKGGVPVNWDPWQLSRVTAFVDEARHRGRPAEIENDSPVDLYEALSIALADSLLRDPEWPSPQICQRCSSLLQEKGLDGWAEGLRDKGSGNWEDFFVAVARLAETGSPESLATKEFQAILDGLGVQGVKVRNLLDGEEIWNMGEGDEGIPVRRGSLEVVPLGSKASSSGGWRLFSAVVGMTPMKTSGGPGQNGGDLSIIGTSQSIRRTVKDLRKVAPSGLAVLLAGETGVGKDLAAQAIHSLSKRKGAYVTVNVASVAETLFEAELFGAVRGAYTGADRDRSGLVEEADGGTLFLDEIGDLALPLQVKLLRFLDSGEVRRVGSGRSRKVDVRVIAASHRNLEQMVADGVFREDLYYRIVSVEILIPPLRERGDDVFLLRDLFADLAVRDKGLSWARWSPEAEELLRRHQWPGNVRELRRVVEAVLLAADGGVVLPQHLPFFSKVALTGDRKASPQRWEDAHQKLRTELIQGALERFDGNRTAAARDLGISRQTLLYHLRHLGIG